MTEYVIGDEKVLYFVPEKPNDAAVKQAKLIIKQYELACAQADRETLVKCTTQCATGKGCGELTSIKDLTYIQTHWYVEPYSCTGGDYWRPGEGAFICPKCGHRNRLYNSLAVMALKKHFSGVVDEHKR